MIVADEQGAPLAELTRIEHVRWGSSIKIRQTSERFVVIPLGSVAALSDSLIDALEHLEARCA